MFCRTWFVRWFWAKVYGACGFEVNASMNDMPNGSAEMTKLQDKLFAEGVITHAQSAQLRGDISKELRSKSVGRF